MRRTALTLTLAAVMAVGGLTGCSSERHAQYTATGAGIGAVTGGILGGVLGSMSGRSAEGVVIGSIMGGLMGASVGDARYQQDRSAEDAANVYAYRGERATRDLVRIEDISATPNVAMPGDEVRLSVRYTMLTRWPSGQLVHEVREVRKEGELVARPEVTVSRQGGTWESTIPLRLPENAEPGTYTVNVIIETDDAGDVRETTFRVEPGSRWRR